MCLARSYTERVSEMRSRKIKFSVCAVMYRKDGEDEPKHVHMTRDVFDNVTVGPDYLMFVDLKYCQEKTAVIDGLWQ